MHNLHLWALIAFVPDTTPPPSKLALRVIGVGARGMVQIDEPESPKNDERYDLVAFVFLPSSQGSGDNRLHYHGYLNVYELMIH